VSPTAQLRPVLTTQGDRYTVAAIVVQESTDGFGGTAELTELASRLAEEARRLLQEERPGATVTAAVALSDPAPAALLGRPTERPGPPGHAGPDGPGPSDAGPGEKAGAGGLEIDRHAYRVSADGRPVELSFREFELLAFLAEHPGRVFSRRQLVSSVWDGAEVGSRTVDVHVRRLRMKLGRHADRIVTVRNVGYRYESTGADLETVA
jgi:DNA-binding response OmpR family regulator